MQLTTPFYRLRGEGWDEGAFHQTQTRGEAPLICPRPASGEVSWYVNLTVGRALP